MERSERLTRLLATKESAWAVSLKPSRLHRAEHFLLAGGFTVMLLLLVLRVTGSSPHAQIAVAFVQVATVDQIGTVCFGVLALLSYVRASYTKIIIKRKLMYTQAVWCLLCKLLFLGSFLDAFIIPFDTSGGQAACTGDGGALGCLRRSTPVNVAVLLFLLAEPWITFRIVQHSNMLISGTASGHASLQNVQLKRWFMVAGPLWVLPRVLLRALHTPAVFIIVAVWYLLWHVVRGYVTMRSASFAAFAPTPLLGLILALNVGLRMATDLVELSFISGAVPGMRLPMLEAFMLFLLVATSVYHHVLSAYAATVSGENALLKSEMDGVKVQLNATRKEIEDRKTSEAARQRFMRYVFHEVRVPFNSIIMGLEVLADEEAAKLSADGQVVLDMLTKAAFAAKTVLNDVLDFSKIENGAFQIALVPSSVAEVIQITALSMTAMARDPDIRVELSTAIDPSIPTLLLADKVRLQQVVANLVSNAIKFAPHDGSGRVKLDVRVLPDEALHMDSAGSGRLFLDLTATKADSGKLASIIRNTKWREPQERGAKTEGPPTISTTTGDIMETLPTSSSPASPSSPRRTFSGHAATVVVHSTEEAHPVHGIAQASARRVTPDLVLTIPTDAHLSASASPHAVHSKQHSRISPDESTGHTPRAASTAARAISSTSMGSDNGQKRPRSTTTEDVSLPSCACARKDYTPDTVVRLPRMTDAAADPHVLEHLHAYDCAVQQVGGSRLPPCMHETACTSMHETRAGDGLLYCTLLISVEDNGTGIPPDELGLLFSAFRQLDAGLQYKGKGTGLGLAICHEIISLHGGRVGVSSTGIKGQGATFTILLRLPVLQQLNSLHNCSYAGDHDHALPARSGSVALPADALRGQEGASAGAHIPRTDTYARMDGTVTPGSAAEAVTGSIRVRHGSGIHLGMSLEDNPYTLPGVSRRESGASAYSEKNPAFPFLRSHIAGEGGLPGLLGIPRVGSSEALSGIVQSHIYTSNAIPMGVGMQGAPIAGKSARSLTTSPLARHCSGGVSGPMLMAGRPLRILCVDDMADNRRLLIRSLKNKLREIGAQTPLSPVSTSIQSEESLSPVHARQSPHAGVGRAGLTAAGPDSQPRPMKRLASPITKDLISVGHVEFDQAEDGHAALAKVLGIPLESVESACLGRCANGRVEVDMDKLPNKGVLPEDRLAVYDVITMDAEMPTLSGFAATRALRAAGYRGLILGATGNGLQQDRDLLLESGCDEVFVKPLSVKCVADAIIQRLQ